jgi:hypothetical protein
MRTSLSLANVSWPQASTGERAAEAAAAEQAKISVTPIKPT